MKNKETFDELFKDYLLFAIKTLDERSFEEILGKSTSEAHNAENSFFNFEGADNVLSAMARQTMSILDAAAKLDLGKMSFDELKRAFKAEVEKEKRKQKKS